MKKIFLIITVLFMSFEVNSSESLVGKKLFCLNQGSIPDFREEIIFLNEVWIGIEFVSKKKIKIYLFPSDQGKLSIRKVKYKESLDKIEFFKDKKSFGYLLRKNLILFYETEKLNFTDDYKKYLKENGTPGNEGPGYTKGYYGFPCNSEPSIDFKKELKPMEDIYQQVLEILKSENKI